jgi:putative phosphonate metabolism protein
LFGAILALRQAQDEERQAGACPAILMLSLSKHDDRAIRTGCRMTSRYAIYYAPDETSNLWRFGTEWLGRDPLTGSPLPQPAVAGLDPAFVAAATGSPRHYGFHATLKPPFALAPGTYAAHLIHALDEFAARRAPFAASRLELARLGRFLAFTLSAPDHRVTALAAACVRDFDRFRAPPTDAELAKRRRATLNDAQEALLAKWGYPHVMDSFRFHMSLTGSLPVDDLDRIEDALRPFVGPFCAAPLPVGSVCLYWQKDGATPFTLIKRFPFRAVSDRLSA